MIDGEEVNRHEIMNNTTYLVVDGDSGNDLSKVIINTIDEDKFVLNIPNLSNGYIIGIKSSHQLTVEDGIKYANKVFPEVKRNNISNIFNEECNKNLMYIDDSKIDMGYISITGTHYGKITIAPAIAKTMSYTIANNMKNFRFEEKVLDIKSISKGFKVTTSKNKFTCKVVINTIPNKKYMIDDEEINKHEIMNNTTYLVVDGDDGNELSKVIINTIDEDKFVLNIPNLSNGYIIDDGNELSKVIINTIDEDKFVLNIPNLSNGYIIGIKSSHQLTVEDGIKYANKVFPEVRRNNISNIFNEECNKNLMYIDDSKIDMGYISITGTHYGKITIAPAIAKTMSYTIANNMKATYKKNFVDKRREVYRFREMNKDQRNEIISLDKRYGNIVCICNQVSEGEIVDCIRRPLGARTIEGIKRRTGAGLGSCYGSYCDRKILSILAREMNKRPSDVVEDSKNSQLWPSRIKEFNGV